MKQSEFAELLGVNRNTITRWEAGERLPDGSSLLRMREAFGADINVILTGRSGGVSPALRPDEEELLAHYRQANSDGRERIRQISATAANSPKRSAKEPSSSSLAKNVSTVTVGSLHGHQIVGDVTNHAPQYFGVAAPVPIRKRGES